MEANFNIRPEREEDFPLIRSLLESAFEGPTEARLVELLRAAGKRVIALTAEQAGNVIGHIFFSEVSVEITPPDFSAVGLAPVAVLPEFQNRGIGSQLCRDGLELCAQAGYTAVVVLGHPNYYPRFGFVRASLFGLDNEYGQDEAFMAMELRPGGLDGVRGLVKFAQEFREAGC